MRIVETSDAFTKALAPEYRTWGVKLTKAEINALKAASDILLKAGELQTRVIEEDAYNPEGAEEDNGRENPYEWARIYIDEALEDQSEVWKCSSSARVQISFRHMFLTATGKA